VQYPNPQELGWNRYKRRPYRFSPRRPIIDEGSCVKESAESNEMVKIRLFGSLMVLSIHCFVSSILENVVVSL